MVDSERGQTKLAARYSNFAKLKWRVEMNESIGAGRVNIRHKNGRMDYCTFRTINYFINGYWHFINRSVYDGWKRYRNDPEGFIDHLIASGYYPEGHKKKEILELIPEAEKLLTEN